VSAASFEGFFLQHGDDDLFCVLHTPSEAVRAKGAVLHVHAFAEEMNKSRQTVAHASRRLAEDGWIVLLVDLFGCGDSPGDFGDATWERWISDVLFAKRWLHETFGLAPVLWGLRAGCLLVTETVKQSETQPPLILWQPVASGKTFFGQFLRLKAAAELFGDPAGRSSSRQLREQLAKGNPIEVVGYAISSPLAARLESAALELPNGYAGRVFWCEVSQNEQAAPSHTADSVRQHSVSIESRVVNGTTFWQTPEFASCPALEAATLAFVRSLAP